MPVIALLITLAVPTVASAQVPVQVSEEKVVSGGKVYYMHEVQKNQTLYSISRAYRVSIDLITSENTIPVNGIQTGQVLRIPSPDQQASVTPPPRQPAQQSAPPAQTRPAQQASGNARVAAASQPVVVNGIMISSEKVASGGRTYYMHEVLKGQTLYSIAKAYKVTILDIDRENVIPAGGLQSGQMLKIPVSTAMTVIEENYASAGTVPSERPAAGTVPSDRPAAGGNASATRPSGTAMPRQETPGQATQMPRQESQMPRQEQPAAQPATGQQKTVEFVSDKPAEVKEAVEAKTQPETVTQPEAGAGAGVQQQTPSAPKSEVKQKPAVEKKKIHKVQKGESLADIAKKYDITVQELKQANKGVIFAMPDMRLVIPVKDEE